MSAKAAFIKDGELSAKIAVQQFLGDRQNPCALSFPVASTTTGKDHEAKSEAFPRRGDSSKVITCAASPPRRPMLRERGSVREKPTDREPAYPPRRSERPTGRPRGSPEIPEAGNLPTPGSPHVSFEAGRRRKPTFSRIRAVAWAPPSNRETRNDWLRTEAWSGRPPRTETWLPLARARRSLPSVRPGGARLRHAHPPRGSVTVTVSEEGHRSVRGSAEPPERRKRNAVKSEKDVVKMVEL